MLSAELLEVLWDCVIAAVFQIGPDDIFLREAEHPQPSSSHRGVNSHTGVSHQLSSFIKPGSDVSNLWPMLQVPAVGHLILPAHIPGVFPEQAHLVIGVPSVPQ